MKVNLNPAETSTFLMCLLTRRNTIKDLLKIECISQGCRDGYVFELDMVKGMLLKFFPASLESLRDSETIAA